MIDFEKTTLPNGLTLLTHQERNTSLVSVNILYNVGARDENPDRTGFAHLFEHLMFGGSANIPSYDQVADNVGAENNAFTNNDITNYYITLPKQNLETALWLESDRMNLLDFSEKSLSVQKNVVTEEYRQRYINQPYGDLWLLLRPLAYKVHPYRWCTIGKDIAHVQDATLGDVEDFFYRYYRPNNAIVAVAGNIDHAEVQDLVAKWFGDIPQGPANKRCLPAEPEQTEAREQTVRRNVPASVIVKSYKMCNRLSPDYYVFDLISDILSNGKSSRMYNELVKRRRLFTKIDAYITGDIDEGQFVVSGYLADGVSPQAADEAIVEQLQSIATQPVDEYELQKVKNNVETTLLFSQYKCIDRAMRIAYFENLGDAALANTEPQMYARITPYDVQRVAKAAFQPQRCSTLYYLKNEITNLMQNEEQKNTVNPAPTQEDGTAPRKRSWLRSLFSRRNLDHLVEKYIAKLLALFRIKLPSKKELYQIIFLSNTKAGKRFDIYLLWVIFISVLIPIMDTVNLLSKVPTLHYIFSTIEWILTIAFTIEYILRIYCLKKPLRYMVSFFGIIDALSIFPFYLALFFPLFGSVTTIRILRILRVFRVLNMKQFMSDSQSMLLILKNSFRKIVVFMMFVFMAAVILGTMVYTVENVRNPMFSSIPKGIYWAIVTITTVGYGDIAPITATGQIIATISMLLGYSVIAVPTGIIGSEAYAVHRGKVKEKIERETERVKAEGNKICYHCGASVHEEDAIYCRHCGWKLHNNIWNSLSRDKKTEPAPEQEFEPDEEEEDIR